MVEFCQEGSEIRNQVADSRRFFEEERRRSEVWHNRLKAATAKRIAHEKACRCGQPNGSVAA